ncbi:MAG: hybrid sensor histidine kinase/response regulator [SAR324 cluster bacterium]|nr:hybrid sensor histidine kinase/response regulator [SAR324 cluster bacterium]
MKDKILIVDDQENNRLVIEDILRKLKCEIRSAASGEEALNILENWIPDLILMDQMMPGLSGIETTARIKSLEAFTHVPIVMVTAKNELETLKDAFEAGAVDYIIKPVERITLTTRAKSALRTKHAFDQIKALTADLQAQKQELIKFTHMVSHDLKSPVASAASLFDFFHYRMQEEHADILKDEGMQDLLNRIPNALKKMLNFVDTMLDYATAGKAVGTIEKVSVEALIGEVLANFEHQIQEGIVTINKMENMPNVPCDPIKIEQVWQNLINNAIKHRGEQTSINIILGWETQTDHYQFWVQDDGPGISPENREKVFEAFLRLSDNVEGSGIGLSTVQQIIKAHGGQIHVDPNFNEGAKFVFSLPKNRI